MTNISVVYEWGFCRHCSKLEMFHNRGRTCNTCKNHMRACGVLYKKYQRKINTV